MPNRILRDWTDSDSIDLLDANSERFFTRLIMKVDDYGIYPANIKLINSTLFPLKSDIRDTDISRWLTECEKSGLVALYNVANKEYLQITNFKQVLRQKFQKYPPPNPCLADDKQMTSRCITQTKRNESETKREETHPLQNSNLFRQPVIPTKQQTLEAFVIRGGTKEMAKKFYNNYEATGWFINGSPMVNFVNKVPGFIENWNKITDKVNGVESLPGNMVQNFTPKKL